MRAAGTCSLLRTLVILVAVQHASSNRERSHLRSVATLGELPLDDTAGENLSAARPISNGSLNCHTADPIHVLYTIDDEALTAVAPSIFSALSNADNPGRLRFHLMVPDHNDATALCVTLQRYNDEKRFPRQQLSHHQRPGFICPRDDVAEVAALVGAPDCRAVGQQHRDTPSCLCGSSQFHMLLLRNHGPTLRKIREQVQLSQARATDRADLANIPNFARNWADELLLPTGVDKVIYLDADTIVKGDLAQLWAERLKEGRTVMMAKNCKKVLHRHFDFTSGIVRHFMADPRGCMYNTGVIVMELRRMAATKVGERITLLYGAHRKAPIWTQGNQQPAFVLALANHTQTMDGRWNTCGLGYTTPHVSPAELSRAGVLHWTGSAKPWLVGGHFKAEWEPYSIATTGNET